MTNAEDNLNRSPATTRGRSPVFVIGCHRSGTNLLYDTLLSAGGFAVYRGFLPVYKVLKPKFGDFSKLANRRRMVETWLRSKGFRRSGLDATALTEKILTECESGGDFIRIVMDEIAQAQNVARWAVYDPDNVLHMSRIKRDIPNALFVHIIRDGRDIALSLNKMGEFRPFPWSRQSRGLEETILYWEWMVRTGQHHGRHIPQDYIEVHYEKLVSEPRQTLARLSEFLNHDLDYDRIQENGLGRLRESNSSFREDPEQPARSVNRWKEKLSKDQVRKLEALAGPCLQQLGYQLSTSPRERNPSLAQRWMQLVYPAFLTFKVWLKVNTPVGRFANISVLELEDSVPTEAALLQK